MNNNTGLARRASVLGETPAEKVVARYSDDLVDAVRSLSQLEVASALTVIERALEEDRSIFTAGNGGSSTTASHMASDILAARLKRGGLGAVMSLSDNIAHFSALANDESYSRVFSRQLEVLASPKDVLVLLSVSGDSPNLLEAARVARKRGMELVALVGRRGKVVEYSQHVVEAGGGDYGLAEDLHLWFNHCLVRHLRHGVPQVCGVPDPESAGTSAQVENVTESML